jgi:hypothetical protein
MSDFFVRGLAFMFLGLALVFILPLLAQLFFSLGPVGFVIVLFVFFAAGSIFS